MRHALRLLVRTPAASALVLTILTLAVAAGAYYRGMFRGLAGDLGEELAGGIPGWLTAGVGRRLPYLPSSSGRYGQHRGSRPPAGSPTGRHGRGPPVRGRLAADSAGPGRAHRPDGT